MFSKSKKKRTSREKKGIATRLRPLAHSQVSRSVVPASVVGVLLGILVRQGPGGRGGGHEARPPRSLEGGDVGFAHQGGTDGSRHAAQLGVHLFRSDDVHLIGGNVKKKINKPKKKKVEKSRNNASIWFLNLFFFRISVIIKRRFTYLASSPDGDSAGHRDCDFLERLPPLLGDGEVGEDVGGCEGPDLIVDQSGCLGVQRGGLDGLWI